MQLTQKETLLLKDLKDEEKLCTEKYTKHSSAATDPQLKNLFSQIAQIEQGHLKMIEELERGTVPDISSKSSSNTPNIANMQFEAYYDQNPSPNKQEDSYFCSDVLAVEKHASSLYNTCVFEFKDENARNVLSHIQKEEQDHGKAIYDYMQTNSMYGS